MAKYKLVDWEDNKYHDSFGKLLYFDTQDNKIHQIEHWSSAYPGEADMSVFLMPTVDIVKKAQKVLTCYYFQRFTQSYYKYKFEPSKDEVLHYGKVILNSDFNGRKQGKLAKGTKLVVLKVSVNKFAPPRYGNDLREDYNVEVSDAEGNTYWINLTKLTLDWEYPSEGETLRRAIVLAKGCSFQDMYKCAWLSHNWALQVYNEGKAL